MIALKFFSLFGLIGFDFLIAWAVLTYVDRTTKPGGTA